MRSSVQVSIALSFSRRQLQAPPVQRRRSANGGAIRRYLRRGAFLRPPGSGADLPRHKCADK